VDFFVLVFRSPGYIFGPLMLLAGLAAVALCLRATFRPDRPSARRALLWSLVPPALGVAGAIFGAVVLALADQPGKDWVQASKYLGCTILFSVFVAVIPALWSLVLLQRRSTVMA
jgi:hypothetical protein